MKKFFLWAILYSTTGFSQVTPSLDPLFGTAGVFKNVNSGIDDGLRGIAVQPDGKIVASGYTGPTGARRVSIIRLHSDGTLDNGFGLGGKVTANYKGNDGASRAVLIQPDGKILSAGAAYTAGGDVNYGLMRFKSNGQLDSTFGEFGKVSTDVGGAGRNDEPFGIILLPDNKIIAGGRSVGPFQNWDFSLVRYLSNGQVDSTFGEFGVVRDEFYDFDDNIFAIAVQPDGKILAAGSTRKFSGAEDAVIARYLPDGGVDSTFGNAGVKIIDAGGSALELLNSLVVNPDGKILAGGYSKQALGNDDVLLVRLLPDGKPDPDFGAQNGIVVRPVGTSEDRIFKVVALDDDRILAFGYSTFFSNDDFMVLRFKSNGELDTEFGGGGYLRLPVGTGNDRMFSAQMLSDGKFIGVGDFISGSFWDQTVVKFQFLFSSVSDKNQVLFDASLSPNPAREESMLSYSLRKTERIRIDLVDMQGKEIAQILPETKQGEGDYSLPVRLRGDVPQGVYFVRIGTESGVASLQLVKLD